MRTRTSQFGEAFERTINKAMTEETPDLPAEHKAKLLGDLLDFYRKHQVTTDLAVESALKLADSPEGAAGAERMAESLRSSAEPDGEAMYELVRSPAVQPVMTSAQAEGVAGVSVGISLGLSLIVGAAAGGDALVNTYDNSACFRGWGIVGAGLDVFIGLGLNVGIWQTLPVLDRKTYLAGFVIDVPVGTYPAAVRFMSVMTGPAFDADHSEFELVGYTLAINVGRGAGFLYYRGVEFAAAIPPRRAQLAVCNCTDGSNPCKPGTSSIGQNISSILDFSLDNTSGKPITIAPDDQMIISMPSYFSSSDLAAIKVTPPSNWSSLGWGTANNLTLVYKGSNTLSWNDSLTFALASAKPSLPSPTQGKVTVKIPDAKVEGATLDKDGIVASASLTLVPSVQYALISYWTAIHPDFTLVSGSTDSGKNVAATSTPNPNDVTTLGQVMNSAGEVWNLGYQFYVDSSLQPCFRACWYQDGKFVQYGKTLYAQNVIPVTSSAGLSIAYYGNNQGNPNTLTITVQLTS